MLEITRFPVPCTKLAVSHSICQEVAVPFSVQPRLAESVAMSDASPEVGVKQLGVSMIAISSIEIYHGLLFI